MSGMPALLHWTPDDDAIAHEPAMTCVCHPHREEIGWRERGSTRQRVIVAVHSRLDGAEPAREA